MTDSLHTLFLAQALGLYLLIISIIMLSRAPYYRNLLTHLKAGSSSIVMTATLGLIFGIILVLLHNIWVWDSRVLITLVAWSILIKSIMWLSFPEFMVRHTRQMYSSEWAYYGASIIVGILGIILMAHGFYLFGVNIIPTSL